MLRQGRGRARAEAAEAPDDRAATSRAESACAPDAVRAWSAGRASSRGRARASPASLQRGVQVSGPVRGRELRARRGAPASRATRDRRAHAAPARAVAATGWALD